MRLAKHRDEIRERFAGILKTWCVAASYRNRIVNVLVLTSTAPCRWIPRSRRILLRHCPTIFSIIRNQYFNVREYARLQSSRIGMLSKGNTMTGGDRRVRECPRYTQVGNAVPPFLADCLGAFSASAGAKTAERPQA